MSLINDVLRDLDKTNANDRVRRDVPPGLMVSDGSAGRRMNLWWRLILLALLVAVAIFGWLSWQRGAQSSSPQTQGIADDAMQKVVSESAIPPEIAAEKVSSKARKKVVERVQNPNSQPHNPSIDTPISRAPPTMQETRKTKTGQAEVSNAGGFSESDFSQPLTRLSGTEADNITTTARARQTVTKTFSAKPTTAKPLIADTETSTTGSGHGSGEKNDQNQPIKIVIKTPPAVSESTTKIPQTNAPEQMVQKPIQLSQNPEALAKRTLRDARALYQQGHTRDAELLLQQQLTQRPELDQSRQQLAGWLLARGGVQEALGLLATVDQNSSAVLREAKAHVLVAVSRPEQAIQLLYANPPKVKTSLSYHGLRAGLLQQAGRYEEALQVYAVLVEAEPTQGDWWIGLGIALDQTGRVEPAVRAYRQALMDKGLSQSLTQYARRRVNQLGAFMGSQLQTGHSQADG